MSKKPKKSKKNRWRGRGRRPPVPSGVPARNSAPDPRAAYEQAAALAEAGDHEEARRAYEILEPAAACEPALRALIRNDLAALAAVAGDREAALVRFREALALDAACEPARANLALLEGESQDAPAQEAPSVPAATPAVAAPIKVALLSFLFNWPSTGGGIVHTVELARFLALAGYEVRHFYARYDPWEIGRVGTPVSFSSVGLEFEESAWNVEAIQERYRRAVRDFDPDYVVITDSWNIKPLLAEAVADYPYVLRLQAMECLCPLNNVRLLVEPDGRARQCPLHQFAAPDECAGCVRERGKQSGGLHQAERALSGVGAPDYPRRLLRAFRGAEAVLVVNPLTEAMVGPYCRGVRVVTAGMDPARFPWPPRRPRPAAAS